MKKVLLLTLAVVIALAFAACSKEEAAETMESSEPAMASYVENEWTNGEDLSGTTVDIFGALVDVDAERFNESMAKFEEATGIDIVYEGSGDFEALITVRTEGGDPPDIAAFPQPGLMKDLHSQGHIADISGWFDDGYLSQQYNDAWLNLATVDGDMTGVWYRANLKSLVWYAVPVFEEMGYEIPETWDEMLALSDQMVADGYKPWSISMESSGATGWVGTDWIEDIMLRTASPEKYDAWVAGELPFDSPEVRNAFKILGEIWFNEDYVLGGTNSILTVPFGDGPSPLLQDPPRALMHRQATFITGFFPNKGEEIPDQINYFYLPPINEEEFGKPVLGAGDLFSPFNDEPATRAVIKFLSQGISTKEWLQQGGFVSPHNDTEMSWYPSEVEKGYAEILQQADTFRFDASDLMPGQVGAGSFWKGMVNWVSGDDLDKVLTNIDNSWPEE